MNFTNALSAYVSADPARFDEASDVIVRHAERSALSEAEAADLAIAIADSGSKVAIPAELRPLADVPSTGGPASLTTLLCPLILAAMGVRVPKLSARGSIAGALDTLAIIPRFRTRLTGAAFIQALSTAGIAHAEAEADFCPADKSLIAARRRAGLMANPALAAASLLAKKLAVPGTHAAFDFRVGATGNIGPNAERAHAAAKFFLRVSERIGLRISITLTDNSTFPCSALGRLESLDLLWHILQARPPRTRLDERHVDTCIKIAARAYLLAIPGHSESAAADRARDLLASGAIRAVFIRHLQTQGATVEGLNEVMSARAAQRVWTVTADRGGYWAAPDLALTKSVFKSAQSLLEREGGPSEAHRQLGVRLLVDAGESVARGQPVLEVRYPDQLGRPGLGGCGENTPQVIEHLP